MRPGLTLATHHSGEPLPEPMRVSAGFLVSGRSGKIEIHTLPPRLMWRGLAVRAGAICPVVEEGGPGAWVGESPQISPAPPPALPPRARGGRFRCFSRPG